MTCALGLTLTPLDTSDAFRALTFTADAVLVAVAAWRLARLSGHAGRSALESLLAWCWCGVALVLGAGVVLGAVGGLGLTGWMGVHFVALVVSGGICPRNLRADFHAWVAWTSEMRRIFSGPRREAVMACALVVAWGSLTVLAALARPIPLDALSYHVPRIGHWLQEGRIGLIGAADERIDFVAALPEVMMTWFATATREGFRLINLTQAIGGAMTIGATIGLARSTGLSRWGSLAAAALLFGMASVAIQFTATQTDLFTAGVFATAFYLGWRALARGRAPVIGCIGLGIALGAKGTLFYLAPGGLLWVVCLARRHRLSCWQWIGAIAATTVGIAFYAGPGFARNVAVYGSALGPRNWVERVHRPAGSLAAVGRKLALNLESCLAQNIAPVAQPHGLRRIGSAAGEALAARLPEADPFTMDGVSRREKLRRDVLPRETPDVDATGFGIMPLLLFALGALFALTRSRQAESRLVLAWAAGVVLFVVFFWAMQQWHPFAFRYFVLVAPWIAVVAAWGIEQCHRQVRRVLWALALLAAADVGAWVTLRTPQAGWNAVSRPERSLPFFVENGWREWAQQLDHADQPFFLALPAERPIAAFYRQKPTRAVHFTRKFETDTALAEDAVRGKHGWTIVPAARWIGREGNVMASVWRFRGDENNPFSLAAYRELIPGEIPRPVVYRNRVSARQGAVTHDLLVKTWGTPTVRLTLRAEGTTDCRFRWVTPDASGTGVIAATGATLVTVLLAANQVSEVKIEFSSSDVAVVNTAVELEP